MRRTRFVALTLSLIGAVSGSACSDDPSRPEGQGALPPTTEAPLPGDTGGDAGDPPGVTQASSTVEGIVATLSLDDRTMDLEQPQQGFATVVLEPGAELLHADGTAADLAEHIATGSAIRATGRPGATPQILLARQVEILGEE